MDWYWRGKGGIVRCRELCMNIGEGRDSSLHLTIPPFPREGGIVRCREP